MVSHNQLTISGASNNLMEHRIFPTVIIGDLDSISTSALNFYKDSVKIIKSECQETTDFQKCMSYLGSSGVCSDIYVLGALGGRLDQTFQNLNTVSKEKMRKIYLFSNECVAFRLNSGKCVILSRVGFEGPACGILPLFGSSFIKTVGLKWNLDCESEFTGMVSTSNAFDGMNIVDIDGILYNRVVIETSKPVIWTCEVNWDNLASV